MGGCALLALACGERGHQARGVVRDLDPAQAQIVIEHGDIPDLMSAMTMSYGVSEPALLEGVERGDAIDFRLERGEDGYRVTRLEVLGHASDGGEDGLRLSDLRTTDEPAPDFALVDQEGAPFALAELRGRSVLLDFVYTRCPGPCPILTGTHVEVQRRLSPEARARTWFVSVSLDPTRDTPEVLRAYARARGADLADWSFLTGPADAVAKVVRDYGIGAIRGEDGEIQHLVATFLIDPEGRIARRYIGNEHDAAELVRDLESGVD